ncbi:hypothetical protein KCH_59220 [Kitasatospora cheerisanensis KCTC 2395]|uniref:Uncharacterized protein n=1 Tax=Kitasatospora cheerisanensis KCTC 2395 TaxID=1348663 RepID=A0A066YWU9_9ACTN|nr:hypothetical protein KCH_59220 [Kitasatospora cheerisanensis KCTC 2395]
MHWRGGRSPPEDSRRSTREGTRHGRPEARPREARRPAAPTPTGTPYRPEDATPRRPLRGPLADARPDGGRPADARPDGAEDLRVPAAGHCRFTLHYAD